MYENVGVVGATGAVGRLVRRLLEERDFPFEAIKFIASARSAGKEIEFQGRLHKVEVLRPEIFDGLDLVIASTPDDIALDFIPHAVEQGAVVVDDVKDWNFVVCRRPQRARIEHEIAVAAKCDREDAAFLVG